MKTPLIIILLLLLLLFCKELDSKLDSNFGYTDIKQSLELFQEIYYMPYQFLWDCFDCNWWQSARALEMLQEFLIISYSHNIQNNFTSKLENITEDIYDHFSQTVPCLNCTGGDLRNQTQFVQCSGGYHDDDGWWGLTMIRIYERFLVSNITEKKYLQMAQDIQGHMRNAWDLQCNGGIPWQHCGEFKASIENIIFMLLSIKLHTYTGLKNYLIDAMETYQWIMDHDLINDDYLVNDGLTGNCTNDYLPGCTYNQALISAALIYLNDYIYPPNYGIELSVNIISSVMNDTNGFLWSDGILREMSCELNGVCDNNEKMFKGIFIQFLKDWYLMMNRKNSTDPNVILVRNFITLNANSIWQTNCKLTFPLIWSYNKHRRIDNPNDFTTNVSSLTALISYLFLLD